MVRDHSDLVPGPVPDACYDDCNNTMLALEKLGLDKEACDPGSATIKLLPRCFACLSYHDADDILEKIGSQYLGHCLPSWNEKQREPAMSVAAEFGYDVVLVGPTGAIRKEAQRASATATISISVTPIHGTPTQSVSDSSSVMTTAPSTPVVIPDAHTPSRGWIAGAVIGPVAFVVLVGLILFLLRHLHNRRQLDDENDGELYVKPELHADGIKQVAPTELDGEKDSCTSDPAELPGDHHDGARELHGQGKELD